MSKIRNQLQNKNVFHKVNEIINLKPLDLLTIYQCFTTALNTFRDFYHFYDNKYGNCYTFNSGMDKAVARITNPGTSFGMNSLFNKMVLFIQKFKPSPYFPCSNQLVWTC